MRLLSKRALDGNVETIILSELLGGENYGYALIHDINEKHSGLLALGEGTIYPVLYRMEEKGLIVSEVRKTATGRDRKYYRVSPKGRKVLQENLRQWESMVKVMQKIRDGIAAKPGTATA